MGIKYSLPLDNIKNLEMVKVAVVTQATSGDAAATTSINAVLDCLKAYHLMATA